MILNNKNQNLLAWWLVWHFMKCRSFYFIALKTFIIWINYFSINLLFLTFFSPWKKYNWSYPRGFNIGEYFGTFVSNIFSRLIGAVCRLFLIVVGILAQVAIFVLGTALILGWFFLPIILILMFLLLFYGF